MVAVPASGSVLGRDQVAQARVAVGKPTRSVDTSFTATLLPPQDNSLLSNHSYRSSERLSSRTAYRQTDLQ